MYDIEFIKEKEKERNIVLRSVIYFLASIGISSTGGYAAFGFGTVDENLADNGNYILFGFDGRERSQYSAVRPILYLKPNETFSSLLGRKD